MTIPPKADPSIYTSASQYFYVGFHIGRRTLVAGAAGYYVLGFAYQTGLMAKVDRLVLDAFFPSVGYFGVGLVMPEVQRRSSLIVRVSAACLAGVLYDILERIFFAVFRFFDFLLKDKQKKPESK